MSRLFALTAPFVSRLFRSEGIRARDVLQLEEVEPVVPPWISAVSRNRITAADEWSSLDFEFGVLEQREAIHAPVVRFEHGPGIVGPDGFATARRRLRFDPAFTRNALFQRASRAEEVAYHNNAAISKFFGHWLADGLSQTMLVIGDAYYLSDPMVARGLSWSHCTEYRKALNLRASDENYIIAKEVITYSDFSQGSSKKQRYAEIKARLASVLPPPTDVGKVFLWRDVTGVGRSFVNPGAVRDRLETEGWTIVDIRAPLNELYPLLAKARIVAGIEGSHLSHANFCTQAGTPMVVLIPHDRFTTIQIGHVRAVGNTFGISVLPGDAMTGYHLDFEDFNEAVDKTHDLAAKSA